MGRTWKDSKFDFKVKKESKKAKVKKQQKVKYSQTESEE